MKKAFLFHGCVVSLIILVAILPVISVAIAGALAEANHCQLDEGSIHPCVINGVDRGSDLYTLAMLGWFMIATIPLGAMALVVYLFLVVLFYGIRWALRKRAAARNPQPSATETG